jgi:lysozyme
MANRTIKGAAGGGVCIVMVIIGLVLGNGQVRTNKEGLELIGNAEGCRRDPYRCPAGDLTDGIGNTHNVHAGVRKTDQQIADDWQKNILIAEKCVNTTFNGAHMNDNQFSAMTSAVFNLGCSGLGYYHGTGEHRAEVYPTGILKDALAENWPAMCDQLMDFDHAIVDKKSVVLPGLKTRREKERDLCLKATA